MTKELMQVQTEIGGEDSLSTILEIRNLNFYYGENRALKDININTLFAQSVYAQVKFHYILRPDYVRWFRHQLEKPYMDKLSSKLKGSCTLVYSSNVGENRSK